jgi:hypothetical protein
LLLPLAVLLLLLQDLMVFYERAYPPGVESQLASYTCLLLLLLLLPPALPLLQPDLQRWALPFKADASSLLPLLLLLRMLQVLMSSARTLPTEAGT